MNWRDCKNILCVRPDNMGDLLMSVPAISAVKQSFRCSVSLLTSSMASGLAAYLPDVDEVIEWNVPWVKGTNLATCENFLEIINKIRNKKFDGAIIFTVFSQNPLPTALMLTLAGIPLRIAYCRENPYHLLSDWIADEEPYAFVRHQVRRDLDLVKSIGAVVSDEKIRIRLPQNVGPRMREKLALAGVDNEKPWLVLHPGVSEEKREYPLDQWIVVGKRIVSELQYQVIITGGTNEKDLAYAISRGIGPAAYSLAGTFALEEFITLIHLAPLIISVNTASVHLAAALETKVIVLYALTNPQHTPWKAIGTVLPYSIPEEKQSRNAVLKFVRSHYFPEKTWEATPEAIVVAARELLIDKREPPIEELLSAVPHSFQPGNLQHLELP